MTVTIAILIAAACTAVFVMVGRRSQAVGYGSIAVATIALLAGLTAGQRGSGGFAPASESAVHGVARDLEIPMPLMEDPEPEEDFVFDPKKHVPREERFHGFVGSQACRECHRREHRSWHASYHRRMTQKATPESVIGDFSEQVLTNAAYVNAGEIRRVGDEFQFRYLLEQGKVRDGDSWKPISLTTGSHHMQAYWLPSGKGNSMDLLPYMYVRESKQWIPREAAFLIPPGEMFYAEKGRWNEICMDCHATGTENRSSSETQSHDTRVGEFGISCEACHGPGEQHVDLRKAHSVDEFNAGELTDPIVNPSELTHARSSEVCGRCHSYRGNKRMDEQSGGYLPGDVLADSQIVVHRNVEKELKEFANLSSKHRSIAEELVEDLPSNFWGDGTIRVAGREFNGLIESPCHQAGEMTCMSCHQMHQSGKDSRKPGEWADDQLGPGMRGDMGCTQCHDASSYETEKHTHHAPGSSGSKCYDCHMPHTSYALLKAVRSHTISSPSVQETVEYRRQNACNHCHLDKSLGWTATHLQEWYGHSKPQLTEDQRNISSTVLAAATGNAIERALVAWHLGWEPALKASDDNSWIPVILSGLLDDEYTAVRFIAGRSLGVQEGYEDIEFDFVADRATRNEVLAEVGRRWAARPKEGRKANPTVLLESGGVFAEATVRRLLQQRDRRRMKINE